MPVVGSACGHHANGAATPRRRTDAEAFTIPYNGSDVRCLFHDQLLAGDPARALLIVLLHGSGADASQWTDIGLIDAIDGVHLDLGSAVHRVVAVAPDIADPSRAPDFVVDTLLPHLDVRFGAGMLAISGISSGAASSLQIARDRHTAMGSVGLHSPAIHLSEPIENASWPCFVDVGNDDPLDNAASNTADVLRKSGIDVSEHHWPGRHDRAYWRQHLTEYVAFHVDVARRGPR